MSKLHQWKHGHYESDLYETSLEALNWALRATTGAHDDGIAVRELEAGEWKRVNFEGYMDNEPGTEWRVGDIVVETNWMHKTVGRIVDLRGPVKFADPDETSDRVLVERFGRAGTVYFRKEDMTLIARDPR